MTDAELIDSLACDSIWDNDVLADTDLVLEAILRELDPFTLTLPLSHDMRGTHLAFIAALSREREPSLRPFRRARRANERPR